MEVGVDGDLYNTIGRDYSLGRRAEPAWERVIASYLTDCDVLVNVGAGTGSYEPDDMMVIAVEPSSAMLDQRSTGSARAIQGRAEMLPLRDVSADCAMTVLSLHHWTDWLVGIAEMKRVAPRLQLVVTFEPAIHNRFWLIEEYLPAMATLPSNNPPTVSEITEELNATSVESLPVPADCVDGVLPAFWARPNAYLDPRVHSYSSSFSLLPRRDIQDGMSRLKADLESGAWLRRHDALTKQDTLDCGFRLIVSRRV